MKPKKIRRKRIKKGFFSFQKNKFSKKTVSYYEEIKILTFELMRISDKIGRCFILCKGNLDTLKSKTKRLSSKGAADLMMYDFIDLQYHLENFCFRIYSYREKMCQFINQALKIGYPEKQPGMMELLKKQEKVKESRINTELKRFSTRASLQWAIEKRGKMTHRIYYRNYNPFMLPFPLLEFPKIKGTFKTFKQFKNLLIRWKKRVKKDVGLSEEAFKQVKDINDSIIDKINKRRSIKK